MTPELRELFANGDPKPEMIDAFLKSNRFPIIDPRAVTFVFRGAADSVLLRLWISGPACDPATREARRDRSVGAPDRLCRKPRASSTSST